MRCYFCHRLLDAIQIGKATDTVIHWMNYNCADCSAGYEYSCELSDVSEYWFQVDDIYAVFMPHNKPIKFMFTFDDGNNSKPAIGFQFLPNITPSNFHQKYKTLITFS